MPHSSRPPASRLVPFALAVLLASSPPVSAQSAGNATLRGTIVDDTGGVLPGATVNLLNVGTRVVRTTTTDDRGAYVFSGVFPGTYDLRVALDGFKTAEQTGLVISPDDTRGLDVRLAIGQQTERITVGANNEVIQTETGAREGVLSAKQIDNLSVVGRSPLELLRILPGVVAPDTTAFESVSFGGGANNTQAYTVNGIRSSANTVSLDGSALIDIGSNSGTMVTLNNDMVQEVKVQSSNFAAEYGAGGMTISAVTKNGGSTFNGALYDYSRNYRFAANDRSNSILGQPKPKSTYQYPGGNIGGPIVIPSWDYTKNRDALFFFFGLEWQRQQVDPGATLGVVPTLAQRHGDFSEFLTANGQNLNQLGAVIIPKGFPGEGTPAPGANLAPYMTPLGKVLVNAYPAPTGSYQDNRYNYVFSQLQPTNRLDMKMRFDWNISTSTKAYVRIAREKEEAEGARGVWWGASDVALPSPGLGANVGRSVSGNIVTVLSPTMTNEALVSWSQLKLDNVYKDPSKMRLDHYGVSFVGSFPDASPYLPGVIGAGLVSGLWAGPGEPYAHNDELTFSDKLTRIVGAHSLKFGASLQRLQKQQNQPYEREGLLTFVPWTNGGTNSVFGDVLVGRIQEMDQESRGPDGRFRMWNTDAFAQDSWKLRSNLTLEYGVRAGYWTNNRELSGLGGYFDPSTYDPAQGEYLDPGSFRRLNGVCYVPTGCAPAGMLPDRSPFAMPRINLAWDIDGEGQNVLRGGYGLFYNRNMGGVEYDQALFLPPAVYTTFTTADQGASFGNGVGLTYDTAREATLASRLGSSPINTLVPGSFKFPKTHSLSVSYARRVFFNQVVEASYVGTRGRNLVSRVNGNVVDQGALLHGTVGNANLSDPIERVALDTSAVNSSRPYQAYPGITNYDFEGVSNYNSLQVTLSRQTGRRLQYFVAYTLSRTKGTLGDEDRLRDPFDASRTYGIRDEDRTHILNVSWNAYLPDGARGSMNNAVMRGVLNGWQLSGISTFASGTPIFLGFSGPAGSAGVAQAYYGTPDIVLLVGQSSQQTGLAPVYTCDPLLGGTKVGEKMLDINCIGFPKFGENGRAVPPYDLRTPYRMNHDLTLFKNFALHGDQKLQLRFGFFNIFNAAYATTANTNDIVLGLSTECNAYQDHVPNGIGGYVDHVCDPTAGFHFTDDTIQNFGKVNLLRGRRIIEFALKYYF